MDFISYLHSVVVLDSRRGSLATSQAFAEWKYELAGCPEFRPDSLVPIIRELADSLEFGYSPSSACPLCSTLYKITYHYQRWILIHSVTTVYNDFVFFFSCSKRIECAAPTSSFPLAINKHPRAQREFITAPLKYLLDESNKWLRQQTRRESLLAFLPSRSLERG